MEWVRDTVWRQGSIIAPADLEGCIDLDFGHEVMGVLVSHDCDIASAEDIEPDVEIVLARRVSEADGNCTFAKNPRRLHLSFDGLEERCDLELIAHQKYRLSKRVLVDLQPDREWSLDHHGRQILQGWLASRYRRHALPDELVERLSPFFSFLNKKLKPSAVEIAGIWIDYDPRDSVLADEPYEFWMYVVYNFQEGEDAQAKAEDLASAVRKNFDRLVLKNRGAGPVELNECMAVSEVAFTLDDLRRNTELKMEHLSHRAFPAGDLIYD